MKTEIRKRRGPNKEEGADGKKLKLKDGKWQEDER